MIECTNERGGDPHILAPIVGLYRPRLYRTDPWKGGGYIRGSDSDAGKVVQPRGKRSIHVHWRWCCPCGHGGDRFPCRRPRWLVPRRYGWRCTSSRHGRGRSSCRDGRRDALLARGPEVVAKRNEERQQTEGEREGALSEGHASGKPAILRCTHV